MGGYSGLAVVVGVALLLTKGQCDVRCGGRDGVAGEAGIPGRNGRAGAKGEKGEPAVMARGPVDEGVLLRLKGEIGSRGQQGVMGPKGYRGDLGPAGQPGGPGRPGPDGTIISQGPQSSQQAQSAFSVMRTDHSYPPINQKVTYQTTVVNNPGDFNAATGDFVCRASGVYYFTFHSVARVSMCLRIVSDAQPNKKLGFCDYKGSGDQVLSGGAVLELRTGQKVWLESFRDQQRETETRDNSEKQIIFSGFLLFSNSE